jgi:4-aminobutyrate aminotransferase-like enzyme
MDTKDKYKQYVNTAFMPAVEPVVIERAEGTIYLAEDGKRYLDCFSGISVTNAGHLNHEIIAAANHQRRRTCKSDKIAERGS